jgi:hypothetical protein
MPVVLGTYLGTRCCVLVVMVLLVLVLVLAANSSCQAPLTCCSGLQWLQNDVAAQWYGGRFGIPGAAAIKQKDVLLAWCFIPCGRGEADVQRVGCRATCVVVVGSTWLAARWPFDCILE